jgi:glycerophosphoryl diester phosphodiesterase
MNFINTKKFLKSCNLVSNIYKLKKDEATKIKRILYSYIDRIENNDFKHSDYKMIDNISLSNEQINIVTSDINKNYKIIACAGSGKTTTIISRIKYLIDHNINPTKILLTTFNVDASEILTKRLNKIFGFSLNITSGTIDSIAFRICKKYYPDEYIGVPELCSKLLYFLENDDRASEITDKYEYIFFDEFQDCNSIQFKILSKFTKSKITIIGDDAQNIYQWRGSDIQYILNTQNLLNKKFITKTLSNNYRSTPEIINLSNQFIKNSHDVIQKNMNPIMKSINFLPEIKKYTSEQNQAKDIVSKIKKLKNVNLMNIGILSRNNYSIKYIEEELEKNKINYVCLITDSTKDTKPKIQDNHITLTTIHKSKGLEFDYVFLISCNDDKFPSELSKIKYEEERRLFYVAITRPKKYLYISFTNNTITRFIGELDKELYNFELYDSKYFKYDDNRNIKFKNGVCEIIELLEPHHIKEMRDNGLIPKIEPITIDIHDKHKYSDFIKKYYLQTDYGIFIDRYITRQIDMKLNLNKVDLISKKVMNSVKLESKLYKMYMKYNFNIQSKLDLLINFDKKYYDYEIRKYQIINLLNKNNFDHKFIKQINYDDIIILIKLVMILIKQSLRLKVLPSQLFISPKLYIPDDFIDKFKNSMNNFNSTKKSKKILEDIYNVSLCQNIYEGRRRLIYKDCFHNFVNDLSLFNDIDEWISLNSNRKFSTKLNLSDLKLSIYGEIDLIDLTRNDESIIDFKCSNNSSSNLEWILQLMIYSALYKKQHNKIINKLQIYNPLRGEITIIQLNNYNLHDELLQYISNVRNLKTLFH